jgi:hypothetical protein
VLLVATALWWPPQQLGLRMPQAHTARAHVLPLTFLVALGLGVRFCTGAQMRAANSPDSHTSGLLLRTSQAVGLNEEWLFRGLALAAFSHWWGWRRGWIAALPAFGRLHLVTLIGGVPPAAAAFQFFNTMLLGCRGVGAVAQDRARAVSRLISRFQAHFRTLEVRPAAAAAWSGPGPTAGHCRPVWPRPGGPTMPAHRETWRVKSMHQPAMKRSHRCRPQATAAVVTARRCAATALRHSPCLLDSTAAG